MAVCACEPPWIGRLTCTQRYGASLRVRTKLPIDNVLLLASLAYQTMPIPPAYGSTVLDDSEAARLARHLFYCLKWKRCFWRGIRQGYVEVRDRLPYVRGRIAFSDQMREVLHPR